MMLCIVFNEAIMENLVQKEQYKAGTASYGGESAGPSQFMVVEADASSAVGQNSDKEIKVEVIWSVEIVLMRSEGDDAKRNRSQEVEPCCRIGFLTSKR